MARISDSGGLGGGADGVHLLGRVDQVGVVGIARAPAWYAHQVAFGKKICRTLDELQGALDTWLQAYYESRPHSGKCYFGKTPLDVGLGYRLRVI